jgi:hypothetical protein
VTPAELLRVERIRAEVCREFDDERLRFEDSLPAGINDRQIEGISQDFAVALWAFRELRAEDSCRPRCLLCGGALPRRWRGQEGRPRRYCGDACKQKAWRTRKPP